MTPATGSGWTSRRAVLTLLVTASVVLSAALLGVNVAATTDDAAAATANGAAAAADSARQSTTAADDTDGDGLTDAEEANGWGTDPTEADTDGDGTDDGAETVDGTPRTDLRTLRVTKVGAEDGRADYSLSTDGRLSGLNDFEDTLDGTSASGRIGPESGNDTVAFAGEITSFSLDGPAVVYLDGNAVQPSELGAETHTLSITKGDTEDGVANYEFSVDGEITPNDDFEDSLDGNTASGRVGPEYGTDSVNFTGNVTSFSLDGPAELYLDGEQVDPATLNGTANVTPIEFDQRYEGDVSDGGRDVYTFTAEEGEYIRIPLSSGFPDAARMTLYAPSGARLDSRLSYPDVIPLGAQAPENGTYRIVVEDGQNGAGSGSYRFSVNVAAPDDFEPNDERSAATQLTGGEPVEAILGENESDWYAVDAREGQQITADLNRQESFWESDFSVTLVGPDGSELDSTSTDCGVGACDPRDVSATAPSDGTYYVHVDGDEARGFIAYDLNVTATGDEPEPETQTLSITKGDTEDGVANYEFSVDGEITPNDDFEDTLDGNTASGRVGPEYGTDSVNFTGNVTSFSLEGPAKVFLDGEEVDPATLNGTSNATRIEPGTSYDGNLSGDERREYTFTAAEGTYLRIPVYGNQFNEYRLTLYGPSGAQLDSRESQPDIIALGAQAPENGTYRIVVETTSGSASTDGNYRFHLDTASPDDFEPDGDRSSATQLASGDSVEAILGQNESDWFAVDAREGQQITVALNRLDVSRQSGLSVTLVAPNGSELDSDSAACGILECRTDDLGATAPSDGTYYVHVDGNMTKGFITYELNVTAASESPAPETHTLSIRKGDTEDGVANYEFTVDGEITPNDDFEDTLDGNTASGRVGPEYGTDSVNFTGDLTDFSLDGPAEVTLDGEEVDPGTLNATSA